MFGNFFLRSKQWCLKVWKEKKRNKKNEREFNATDWWVIKKNFPNRFPRCVCWVFETVMKRRVTYYIKECERCAPRVTGKLRHCEIALSQFVSSLSFSFFATSVSVRDNTQLQTLHLSSRHFMFH